MKPCLISFRAKNEDGYAFITINNKTEREHRYVYSKYHNVELSKEDIIMHTCDNPGCVEITHLKLGTVTLNNRDKVNKKRHNMPTREQHPNSKLSEEKVQAIRNLFSTRIFTRKELAKEFNISASTVGRIINNEYWKC